MVLSREASPFLWSGDYSSLGVPRKATFRRMARFDSGIPIAIFEIDPAAEAGDDHRYTVVAVISRYDPQAFERVDIADPLTVNICGFAEDLLEASIFQKSDLDFFAIGTLGSSPGWQHYQISG